MWNKLLILLGIRNRYEIDSEEEFNFNEEGEPIYSWIKYTTLDKLTGKESVECKYYDKV